MPLSVSKGNDKTILTISGTFSEDTAFDPVELSGNSVVLNLKDVFVVPSDATVSNSGDVSLFKIRVDFGDGKSQLFSRSIKAESSTIYKEPTPWNEVEHYINSEEEKKVSEIVATLYNTFGDAYKLTIPYTLRAASLSFVGTEFDLIAANTTNDNRVSYVFRHKASDSVISVFSDTNAVGTLGSGNTIEEANP